MLALKSFLGQCYQISSSQEIQQATKYLRMTKTFWGRLCIEKLPYVKYDLCILLDGMGIGFKTTGVSVVFRRCVCVSPSSSMVKIDVLFISSKETPYRDALLCCK